MPSWAGATSHRARSSACHETFRATPWPTSSQQLQLHNARRLAPITYKCPLAEKINLDTSGHFSLWLSPLTPLPGQARCRRSPTQPSPPLLSVVCRKNGRPGEGYWKEKTRPYNQARGEWQNRGAPKGGQQSFQLLRQRFVSSFHRDRPSFRVGGNTVDHGYRYCPCGMLS